MNRIYVRRTYVEVGIVFDPHVAAVFTSQIKDMHGQGTVKVRV